MTNQRSKASLLGIVLFLWGATLFAWPPDTLWTKTYGGSERDEAFSVQQTSDGSYIVAGRTESFGSGKADVWLIKTDADGDTLWTRIYGGTGWDIGYSVCQTSDGSYIVAGYTESFGAGEADVWLIKTDADGDTLWTRTYGDTGWDAGSAVCETSDGSYIVAGSTASFGAGKADVWLIKTDINGETLWTKTYGGAGSDGAGSVCETSDKGYIITGSMYVSSEVVSSFEVYLIKTDANGDSLWTRTYGQPAAIDHGASVCETSDGGYIIAGSSFYAGYEVLLLKTDANGDSLWARTYGQDRRHDHGRSVCETSDGGYIIAGDKQTSVLSYYNIYLMKTDASGEVLWTRDYGYPGTWNQGYSVCETSDGGYIVAGSADYLDPPNRDVWLGKLEPDVGIEENEPSRETFVLSEPEPNPFAEQTSIKYSLPRSGRVRIAIYDPLGRKVRTLLDSPQSPGIHTITWEGRDDEGEPLSAGVYFLRFLVEGYVQTARLVMVR